MDPNAARVAIAGAALDVREYRPSDGQLPAEFVLGDGRIVRVHDGTAVIRRRIGDGLGMFVQSAGHGTQEDLMRALLRGEPRVGRPPGEGL